jgi:hypothetical protein
MIKKNFKLDKTGKTEAYFYKQSSPYLDKKLLDFLKKKIKKKNLILEFVYIKTRVVNYIT